MYGIEFPSLGTRTPFIGKISSIEMDWYDVYMRFVIGAESYSMYVCRQSILW